MEFKTPISLKKEREELHDLLRKATQLSAKTGEAAKTVAELMHPHFVKEEEYALPLLGLLPQLSSGKHTEEMKQVLTMMDKLKKELPEMLAEHKQIVAALEVLVRFVWNNIVSEDRCIVKVEERFVYTFLTVDSKKTQIRG